MMIADGLELKEFPNLKKWFDGIMSRPAAVKGALCACPVMLLNEFLDLKTWLKGTMLRSAVVEGALCVCPVMLLWVLLQAA